MIKALSYIAGILDGEGCISANKRRQRGGLGYSPRVAIAMADPEAVQFAASVLGGMVRVQHRPRKRPLYTVVWCNGAAADVCRKLLPYLLVKKDQAAALIALAELRKVNHHVGRIAISNRPQQEALYLYLRELKRPEHVKLLTLPVAVKVSRPVRHGTRFGYHQGCRCGSCRGSNAAHQRAVRARRVVRS